MLHMFPNMKHGKYYETTMHVFNDKGDTYIQKLTVTAMKDLILSNLCFGWKSASKTRFIIWDELSLLAACMLNI